MKQKNILITYRDEVNEKMKVTIKGVSHFLNNDNDLYVHGGIWIKEGYVDIVNHHMVVKGDVLNCNGRILYTLRDWSDKRLEESGYDAFELYCSSINRFLEVKEISEVKVYVVRVKD